MFFPYSTQLQFLLVIISFFFDLFASDPIHTSHSETKFIKQTDRQADIQKAGQTESDQHKINLSKRMNTDGSARYHYNYIVGVD